MSRRAPFIGGVDQFAKARDKLEYNGGVTLVLSTVGVRVE
jgi:hypothetical protein